MEIEKEVRYEIDNELKDNIINNTIPYKGKTNMLDITCGYDGFNSLKKYGYICRVREKNNNITLEVKNYVNNNESIEQSIKIDKVVDGVNYLRLIGMKPYLYLKRNREVRKYKNLLIFIDEFDILGKYVEIEYQDSDILELEEFIKLIGISSSSKDKYGDIVKEKLNDEEFNRVFNDNLNKIIKESENKNMNYEDYIKNILGSEYIDSELVSETSNVVYKVNTKNNGVLYAKFYKNNSSHIDNEIKIYDLVDNKYLKELYYVNDDKSIALFKELKGKTIDSLNEEEIELNKEKIIDSLIEFYTSIGSKKTEGYGLLDKDLKGKYKDFHEFLINRQTDTSNNLKDYEELSSLFNKIYINYENLLNDDNSLVPIDTNLKNIMLCDDGSIKFIDPGEMISAPVLMGYGDFVAHVYKTKLYDVLIEKLNPTPDEEKLIRIYAIFSSLNILSFLHNLGVEDLSSVIPFGNTHTFYELIADHAKYLKLKR